jgi:hypothetical protein
MVAVPEVYLCFLLTTITNILAKVLAGFSSDRPGTPNEAKESLPFISFPIHHALIILSFDTIQPKLLTASLNKA